MLMLALRAYCERSLSALFTKNAGFIGIPAVPVYLPGTIPSFHCFNWWSHPSEGSFLPPVLLWEWPVTKEPAKLLWIALLVFWCRHPLRHFVMNKERVSAFVRNGQVAMGGYYDFPNHLVWAKGHARDAPWDLGQKVSFIFIQFSQEMWSNNRFSCQTQRWATPLV